MTVAFLRENPTASDAGREALHLAAAHKLPIMFVYASGSIEAAEMHAFGFPIIPVDGNDVVAVYRVAHECIVRARQGGGPSAIACSFEESGRDPLRNMEKYLGTKGLFKARQREKTIASFELMLQEARKAARKSSRGRSASQANRLFVF